jgi:hypothetical protein
MRVEAAVSLERARALLTPPLLVNRKSTLQKYVLTRILSSHTRRADATRLRVCGVEDGSPAG